MQQKNILREHLIEPFAEGFFGALRLFVAIVATPWAAVNTFVRKT